MEKKMQTTIDTPPCRVAATPAHKHGGYFGATVLRSWGGNDLIDGLEMITGALKRLRSREASLIGLPRRMAEELPFRLTAFAQNGGVLHEVEVSLHPKVVAYVALERVDVEPTKEEVNRLVTRMRF